MAPAEALRQTLFGGLPTTPDTKLHWTVTLAFAAQASADAQLATIQREAYLHFRSTVVKLVVASGRSRAGAAAAKEADRLIATVNGIALQALFAPDLWTKHRQVAALSAALEQPSH